MDLIRSFIAILRRGARWLRGDDDSDEPDSNWGQRYQYSEVRDYDSFITKQRYQNPGETRRATVTPTPTSPYPPLTPQSKVSKPTSSLTNEFPASLSTATKISSVSPSLKISLPPPTVADKPTPTTTTQSTLLGGLTVLGRVPKPSEVSTKQLRDSLPPLSTAPSQAKPRDLFSSSSVLPKQNEVSKMPTGRPLSSSVLPGLAAQNHSFNSIIQANNTGENKGTSPKCSDHLFSPSPSSHSSEHKLLYSNTAKPLPQSPSPSPLSKPNSSSTSLVQTKVSLSTKPALRMGSSQNSYIWVEKDATPTYAAPDDLKRLIPMNIVPQVLKKPLSVSTYKDYFCALLNAEDIYIEKWNDFEMKDVTLELHNAAIYNRNRHNRFAEDDQKHEKTFVAFEIDKVPERRPFLISRDFVILKPSKKNFPIFEGLVYRVVRSNLLLSEFGDDFLYQHRPTCKYDVMFSFNRVCLKRAHQAIESASAPLFSNFLFPENLPKSRHLSSQYSVIDKILRLRASPPYLVKRELCVIRDRKRGPCLSETGNLIVEAVVKLIQSSPLNRILLCAPANTTCDLLLRGLKWMQVIPEHDIFRANAAFREREEVPEDILPSCTYEDETECFFCPSLDELRRFKVILSTFMSSHRLHSEGLKAGHFSHLILADASSAIEPEALLPLANFATEGTAVVVFGAPGNRSSWIRSPMAREFGLARSYFERLCNSKLYASLDPNLITVHNNDDGDY